LKGAAAWIENRNFYKNPSVTRQPNLRLQIRRRHPVGLS
jgi:hypothetical protein